MQELDKSADCSRHCRPGNQLTAQTIGRLFPLAKTYTNTNILIHIEKNKHKHSSTLCCPLFLRGVRQRAGPYGKERTPPQVKPILRNLFWCWRQRGGAEHFSAHFNHLHFSWKSSRWGFGPAWIKSLRWPQESLRYLFHSVPKKSWRCMDISGG